MHHGLNAADIRHRTKKYQRRVEFLKRLGELVEEFHAEFAVHTEFPSEGSFTTEIEVYVDGCSNLCGDQRDGLTAAGIERMLNCASESLAEAGKSRGDTHFV